MLHSLFPFFGGLGAGFSGGVLSGLFGIGGGIVLVPLMGLVLGLHQQAAQGVALAATLPPLGLPAVLQYRRSGVPIHWRIIGFLIAAFLVGGWLGARLANHLPSREMRWIFVVFLLVVAVRTWLGVKGKQGQERSTALAWSEAALPGLGIGFIGGISSGLLGIGGGIIMVPLMVGFLKLPQHQAQLASLTMMLFPVGLPAVWVYALSQGHFPWVILIGVALGFTCGALLGAKVANRLHGRHLKKIFAALVVLMALLLVLK
nr:sulfite exporter TauE/SafE family protein [uncultured Holophaga sp.]